MHRPTSGHPSTTGAGDACVAPTVSSFEHAWTNPRTRHSALGENAGDPPQAATPRSRWVAKRVARPYISARILHQYAFIRLKVVDCHEDIPRVQGCSLHHCPLCGFWLDILPQISPHRSRSEDVRARSVRPKGEGQDGPSSMLRRGDACIARHQGIQHHRCGRRMRRPYGIFIREHESGTKCGRPMGRPYDIYSANWCNIRASADIAVGASGFPAPASAGEAWPRKWWATRGVAGLGRGMASPLRYAG